MAPPTGQELHDALVRALAPVTRWRHPAYGSPARVNTNGVDVWENHVGDVRLDPTAPGVPATVHAYVFLQTGPGGQQWTRAVAAATVTRWRPILTFVGGTPDKVEWGMGLVLPILDGLTLTTTTGEPLTGPMHQGSTPGEDYDPGPLQLDDDPSPPRWFAPVQYGTTAH